MEDFSKGFGCHILEHTKMPPIRRASGFLPAGLALASGVRQKAASCIRGVTTTMPGFSRLTEIVSTSQLNQSLPAYASTESSPAVASGGPFHLIALLTAIATFPLIFMGGLVTSHQAGLSVPDWPNSYGYNMFLFPPRLWIGGILYEHTHRLMATVVGMLAIALVIAAFATQNASRTQRGLALAVLGGVIFQGVLGGLRVVLLKLDLAIVHACVAQAFFCLTALTALATSRQWNQPQPIMDDHTFRHGTRLVWLAVATVTVIYLQLIAGATMRHFQAGLAIPDLPLAYGKVLPPMNPDQLDAANWIRIRQFDLDPVTMSQIWIHFVHRFGAVVVSAMILVLATVVFRRYRMQPLLVRPAGLLIVLLAAQLTLGVLTVLLRKPADIASAHVAVGALVLVTSFVLTARAIHLYGLWRPMENRGNSARAGVPKPQSLVMG
jgi:cytochrome c oxidase assembly protein subunit 15